MSEARVTLAIVDGIAHLTFDHPRRMNAITASMWRHSSTSISAPSPWASRRITMANAANFGAEPMNMVTAVGAPS